MKKKLTAILCAVALMMALPTMAWAAQFNSPGGTSVTSNGTTLYVKGDVNSNGGYIVVEPTDNHAGNSEYADDDYVASFKVYKVGEITFTSLDLTFNTPSAYAGAKATIYADYGNGKYEVHPVTLSADGVASITVTEIPSTFTIVVTADDAAAAGGLADTGKDTSSTSPQTGVDFTGIAVAGTVMAVAACGVACALRKKTVA